MKLIIKFTLLYLLISLGVFYLGGVITYQVVKREIDLEQKLFLEERLGFVTRMIERRAPKEALIRDKIVILPVADTTPVTDLQYSDTLVMHSTLERLEPHVKLDVVSRINDRTYKISIYDLIVEEDDIVESVQESMIKFFLVLTVIILVIGWIASFYLLKPFNQTLVWIKGFNLEKGEPIAFKRSTTLEFNKLNQFLKEMTRKMQSDYRVLREFTENASHEMQTPLTNAIGKLELLLSSGSLTQEDSTKVIATLDSLKHLSRIGKSLNLLTKIENREFSDIGSVNFSKSLKKVLENFNELMELKSISLDTRIKENIHVHMDPTLTTILINNLVSNAIRHNNENGYIRIKLDETGFIICNSGQRLTVPPDTMFDRFKKHRQHGDGLGLGLAIVKKICEVSDFSVSYTQEITEHRIEIQFNS